MDRILLAVDSSEHSQRATDLAGRLSAAFDAPVVVVNVVSDTTPVAPASGQAIHEYAKIENVVITQREMLQSHGMALVAQAGVRIETAGGTVESTEVSIGSPAKEIVRIAEDRDADCIVMGRRGLGDIGGIFMGSVSHKVGHLTARTLITTE